MATKPFNCILFVSSRPSGGPRPLYDRFQDITFGVMEYIFPRPLDYGARGGYRRYSGDFVCRYKSRFCLLGGPWKWRVFTGAKLFDDCFFEEY